MGNVVVVGSQWGDEGKGKIVDWLSEQADVVVRFQGGHNAGHTLVIDGVTFKLSLLPSGVVRPNKLSVIGNGVVVDPNALLEEIARVQAQGIAITPDNLRIAENAALILPLHRELDEFRENSNSGQRIGTTKRGIGPAYEDKVGRRAIRLMDLADLDGLRGKIDGLLAHHNALRRGCGLPEASGAAIYDDLARVAPKVLPFMDTVWALLDGKRREGKRILFEGAQGALLDIDHGTYPFVTSSNTVAGQAATGSGLGPGAIDYVLGICKAYTTRVGEGRSRPSRATRSAFGSGIGGASSAPLREGGAAAAGSTPCWCARPAGPAASTGWRSPSSTSSTGSTRSRSASATASTAGKSTIFRPAPARRRASSRFMRQWRGGKARRRGRDRGPNCPRRR